MGRVPRETAVARYAGRRRSLSEAAGARAVSDCVHDRAIRIAKLDRVGPVLPDADRWGCRVHEVDVGVGRVGTGDQKVTIGRDSGARQIERLVVGAGGSVDACKRPTRERATGRPEQLDELVDVGAGVVVEDLVDDDRAARIRDEGGYGRAQRELVCTREAGPANTVGPLNTVGAGGAARPDRALKAGGPRWPCRASSAPRSAARGERLLGDRRAGEPLLVAILLVAAEAAWASGAVVARVTLGSSRTRVALRTGFACHGCSCLDGRYAPQERPGLPVQVFRADGASADVAARDGSVLDVLAGEQHLLRRGHAAAERHEQGDKRYPQGDRRTASSVPTLPHELRSSQSHARIGHHHSPGQCAVGKRA